MVLFWSHFSTSLAHDPTIEILRSSTVGNRTLIGPLERYILETFIENQKKLRRPGRAAPNADSPDPTIVGNQWSETPNQADFQLCRLLGAQMITLNALRLSGADKILRSGQGL